MRELGNKIICAVHHTTPRLVIIKRWSSSFVLKSSISQDNRRINIVEFFWTRIRRYERFHAIINKSSILNVSVMNFSCDDFSGQF